MRVLLDECLPRRLKRELVGHDARTAPEMGWANMRNGELLRVAAREFDVFLTVDRKLQHQQDLSAFNIAVVVLVAHSNTLADLHWCRRFWSNFQTQTWTRVGGGQSRRRSTTKN